MKATPAENKRRPYAPFTTYAGEVQPGSVSTIFRFSGNRQSGEFALADICGKAMNPTAVGCLSKRATLSVEPITGRTWGYLVPLPDTGGRVSGPLLFGPDLGMPAANKMRPQRTARGLGGDYQMALAKMYRRDKQVEWSSQRLSAEQARV